jgi:hypothetical protein
VRPTIIGPFQAYLHNICGKFCLKAGINGLEMLIGQFHGVGGEASAGEPSEAGGAFKFGGGIAVWPVPLAHWTNSRRKLRGRGVLYEQVYFTILQSKIVSSKAFV